SPPYATTHCNAAAWDSPPAAAAGTGGLLHLTLGLPLAQRGALVVQLLAAGQADLDLDPATLEVDLQRHDRQALLGRLAHDAGDLALVEQQLAVALGLVIGVGAVAVRIDVTAPEPRLAVTHGGVGILEVHLPVAQGFDLGPAQHKAGLESLEDLVLVSRASVRCDDSIFGRHPVLLTCPARAISWVLARAEVAELADALDSGSSARKGVGVRVPASAPTPTSAAPSPHSTADQQHSDLSFRQVA